MSVVIITFAGLVMLYRVCLPLNLYRTVLLLAMSACCILGVTVMPTMFFGEGYAPLDFVCILYVIVVVMLCVPLSGIFIKIFDRMRENKKNDDLRGLPLRG